MIPIGELHRAQLEREDAYVRTIETSPRIDAVGDRPDGSPVWIGRVTARYGDFVSVEEVDGDLHAPAKKINGRAEAFVYAGPAHPWIKADPVKGRDADLLVIVPMPRGFTATKISKTGAAILDVDRNPVTVTLKWAALGTVPEADEDTFGGVAAACVFDPDEPLEGCMFAEPDDTPPVAAN